ncbi:MAG TPA: tRNA epoxyqueuosine(34) reductase QueG [Nitrospiria bacterium]
MTDGGAPNPPPNDRAWLTGRILEQARALGFDAVGIAPAARLTQDGEALSRWLSEGRHGGMAYLAREPHRRAEPEAVLPGARSVIVLGLNYFPSDTSEPPAAEPSLPSGRISRYAWGEDYHAVIEERLARLQIFLREAGGPETESRAYVDHGPVLEKALARLSGIGFIGKNTLLITEEFGSWVFLAVILTTLELEAGPPRLSECGSCRACLDACPTGALTEPYRIDARRCISYLTIENKGNIDETLEPKLNGWAFGCDICQEVCPYNFRPKRTAVQAFHPGSGAGPWLDLGRVAALESDEAFREAFLGTPLLRPKRSGLMRNAKALLRTREK